MLEILNPTELPGNDWIKQGCWIYKEEKKLLASKRAVKRIKVWGMRKEVPSCRNAPSCFKKFHYTVPVLLLHIMGDREEIGWLLCLYYAHAKIPKHCGCYLFEGAMGLKSKIQHSSPGCSLQFLVSCVLLLPLQSPATSPGELIDFLPGVWHCSFFLSAGSSVIP